MDALTEQEQGLERTERPYNRVFAAYEELRSRERIMGWIVGTPIVLIFVRAYLSGQEEYVLNSTESLIFWGCFLGGTLYSRFNWRCPVCNGYLTRIKYRYSARDRDPTHCRHCNEQLQPE